MTYNALDKPYFCPNCGYFVKPTDKECKACEAQITPIQSYYNIRYCMDMAKNKYGSSERWHDWMRENVISLNEYYDKSSVKFPDIQEHIKKQVSDINKNLSYALDSEAQKDYERNVYQPKCPICGSPHIKKISTTKKVMGAATFGIFSKTARSQWQCSSCGSKF